MIRAAFALTIAASLAAAVPAAADDAFVGADTAEVGEVAAPIVRPNVLRDSIELQTGLLSTQRVGQTWPLVLSAQYRLAALPAGTLVGAVALPGAAGTEDRNGEGGGFAPGNPTATLTYALSTGAITPFVGARIAAPIASAGSQRADLVVERAGAANGYYDYHLWAFGYLPLALPFGIEIQPVSALWLRGSFAPLLYVTIERWAETEASMQGEVQIEGRSPRGAGGGVALRAVANGVYRKAVDDPDGTQASVEPYFVYDGKVLVRAGVMIALDTPLGFGEDNDAPIVAPHLTIGLRLDALTAPRTARSAAR